MTQAEPVEDLDKVKLYELFESDGEFQNGDPLRIATTAALAQIKSDIEDSAFKGKFTVKALLNKLRNNGVNINHDQLLDLVNEEPWSNLISNIQGDQVIFKGEFEETDDEGEPYDDSEEIVSNMAKRAAKKQ